MNKTVMHPVYGAITYDENIWTGKKTVTVNGVPLAKRTKNIFSLSNGAESIPVTLKGNAMTGASIVIGGEALELYPKPSVLDWILSMLPFVLVMVWGNSRALCEIVPVVGGAIGGAVSGMAIVLCMTALREKSVGKKLLIALLALAATFAVCAAIGYVILAL